MRVSGRVPAGVGGDDFQFVLPAGDVFPVEAAGNGGMFVHFEEDELPVDRAFVVFHAAEVVGEAELEPFPALPFGGTERGDAGRDRVDGQRVSP